jgi:ribosomal protein S12 methylthiotransferase
MSQRAEDRIGSELEVLVESVGEVITGRGEHQAPEVDGQVTLRGADGLKIGDLVRVTVIDSEGADLIAEVKVGTAR